MDTTSPLAGAAVGAASTVTSALEDPIATTSELVLRWGATAKAGLGCCGPWLVSRGARGFPDGMLYKNHQGGSNCARTAPNAGLARFVFTPTERVGNWTSFWSSVTFPVTSLFQSENRRELWAVPDMLTVLVESLEVHLCTGNPIPRWGNRPRPAGVPDTWAARHVRELMGEETGATRDFLAAFMKNERGTEIADPALRPVLGTLSTWGIQETPGYEGTITFWGFMDDYSEAAPFRHNWLTVGADLTSDRDRTRYVLESFGSPQTGVAEHLPASRDFWLAVLNDTGFTPDGQFVGDTICKGLGEEHLPEDIPEVGHRDYSHRALIPWLLQPENQALAASVRARVELLNQSYIDGRRRTIRTEADRQEVEATLVEPDGRRGDPIINSFLRRYDYESQAPR